VCAMGVRVESACVCVKLLGASRITLATPLLSLTLLVLLIVIIISLSLRTRTTTPGSRLRCAPRDVDWGRLKRWLPFIRSRSTGRLCLVGAQRHSPQAMKPVDPADDHPQYYPGTITRHAMPSDATTPL
jgi:hypothetical protein